MEEINIRDTRNGSWYWVNTAVNACPHISPTDKTVYAALCTFGGCAEIRPTFALISQRSALSVRSCKYSIIKLLEVGYISIENHGKKGVANVYNLLKAVNGCKKCKPCTTKEVQEMSEEVQDRAGSSANLAPQIDKEINKKEIDKSISPLEEKNTEIIEDCDEEGYTINKRKKSPPRNKLATALVHEFANMAKKEIGTYPVLNVKSYNIALFALKHLEPDNIRLLYKDWFSSGKPDEELVHITRALSGNNINNFKIQNGLT